MVSSKIASEGQIKVHVPVRKAKSDTAAIGVMMDDHCIEMESAKENERDVDVTKSNETLVCNVDCVAEVTPISPDRSKTWVLLLRRVQ